MGKIEDDSKYVSFAEGACDYNIIYCSEWNDLAGSKCDMEFAY